MRRFYAAETPFSEKGAVPVLAFRLFRRRAGDLIRAMFMAAGLFLLVAVVAGAVLLVALNRPHIIGSSYGGYTADMTILAMGMLLMALFAGLLFLLAPRAVSVCYEELSCRAYGVYRGDRMLSSGAGRAMRTCYRTWWACLSFSCVGGLVGFGVALATGSIWPGLGTAWLIGVFARLSIPVNLFEGKAGFPALFTGISLTARHFPRVLVCRLAYELPGYGLLLAVCLAPYFLISRDVFFATVCAALLGGILLQALIPYFAALDTVLYFRLRGEAALWRALPELPEADQGRKGKKGEKGKDGKKIASGRAAALPGEETGV